MADQDSEKIISEKGIRNRGIVIALFSFLCILGTGLILQDQPAEGQEEATVESTTTQTTEAKLEIKKKVRLDVPLINQLDEPRLINGCEVTSLAMLLNYWKIEVSKTDLAEAISTVPYLDDNNYYGNPSEGFVGDIPNGPGYFVYHEPILELTQEYLTDDLEVVNLTGQSFEVLQEYLSQDAPVWVICTATFTHTNDNEIWQTATGEIEISMNEHSVVITGYDRKKVFLNDPYGKKDFETNQTDFIESWEQLGRQAITIIKGDK